MDVRAVGTVDLEILRSTVNQELRRRGGPAQPASDKAEPRDGPSHDTAAMMSIAGPISRGEQTTAYEPGLSLANVEDAFRYHPWTRDQAERGEEVREALVFAAKTILRNVPPGPDRSTALRKLREVRMDANSAITHNGRF